MTSSAAAPRVKASFHRALSTKRPLHPRAISTLHAHPVQERRVSLESDPDPLERFDSFIDRTNCPTEHCIRLRSELLHFLNTQGRAGTIEHNGKIIFGHELKAKNVLVEGTGPCTVRRGDKCNETGGAEHDAKLTPQPPRNQFRFRS